MRIAVISLFCLSLVSGIAGAEPSVLPTPVNWQSAMLNQTATAMPLALIAASAPPAATTQEAEVSPPDEPPARGFKGVNDFFNVREAYSDVEQGEWQFAVGSGWNTWYRRQRDHVELWQYIRYGVTDDMHLALKIMEPLGYGGRGVPELELTVFNTFWHEGDILPAFAGYASMRIPTGYQSANVDGKFGGVMTKTIFPRFRAHLEGYVMTANGERGDVGHVYDRFGLDRMDFQWAVGPGFDYQIGDNTLLLLNYLHHSSMTEGEGNMHLLEAGVVHKFGETERHYSQIKFAADVGASGQGDEPHIGCKFQYEFYLR